MDIKIILKNYINQKTKPIWEKVMLECGSEQMSDLTTEYDIELESVMHHILSYLDDGIDDLVFTLEDFISSEGFAWEEPFNLTEKEEEKEEEVEVKKFGAFTWNSDIKEQFKY